MGGFLLKLEDLELMMESMLVGEGFISSYSYNFLFWRIWRWRIVRYSRMSSNVYGKTDVVIVGQKSAIMVTTPGAEENKLDEWV